MAKKKNLKANVERQISEMLDSKEEPSEGRMKLLALGIKMLAVNAKLEENEYGEFFAPTEGDRPYGSERGDPGGIPVEPGQKPAGGKRANGGGKT